MALYKNIGEPLMTTTAVDFKSVVKSSEIGGRGNNIKAYVGMIYFDEETGNIRCVQAVGPEGTVARNTSVLDSTNEAAIHALIENTDTGLRQLVEDTETKIGTQITTSIEGVNTQISNLQKDVDGVKEAVDDETIEKIGQADKYAIGLCSEEQGGQLTLRMQIVMA